MKNKHEVSTEAARKRVAAMDAIDGFRDRSVETILAALETGLRSVENQDCLYDAFVMLLDVQKEQPK